MRKRLVVDIETASACDLSACGSWVYAEHDTAEILCIAYADADTDDPPTIWRQSERGRLNEVLSELLYADKLIAHNAAFEREMLGAINPAFMERGRWIDTAMLCGAVGRPRALRDACKALCLPVDKQKDAAGTRLLALFSMKGRKGHKTPEEAPQAFDQLCQYCKQDVIAEREIFQLLEAHADARFNQQFDLDMQVTDNGVPIDYREVYGAARLYELIQEDAESQCLTLTGGAPMRSTPALRAWTASKGWPLESFSAASVEEALADEYMCGLHPEVAEFLRLRQAASGTAGKKFAAVLSMRAKDDACHGILVGRGSHTGRYAGRGFQPQNLPRGNFDKFLLRAVRELAYSAARAETDAELVTVKNDLELIAGSQSCAALSMLLRDCIAPERTGECLVVSDYSAIEARVLAWIAGETWVEEIFATDGKIYERTAAAMYAKSVESISKHERMAGKIATLALGFGGGVGALNRMAVAYGVHFTDEQAQGIVDTWRASRPKTVKFWDSINRAAQGAVRAGKASVQTDHARIDMQTERIAGRLVLSITLPSKRKIYYWNPKIVRLESKRDEIVVESYGATGDNYAGITPEAEGSHNSKLYGGKITENIVQAIAFDLLLNSLLKLNDRGLKIRFHVHDEIVISCRRERAEKVAETMVADMTAAPEWASGLHLATEPEIMERYKK